MKIEVTNQESQIAVAIKRTAVSMENLPENIHDMCAKLMAYLTEQGKNITGVPYLAYSNASDDFSQFDIEWGFPVAEPIPASDEIYMSQTYGGKAIVATYKGPYNELEKGYCAVMDYAKENSLESTGVYYDYYLNDPDEVPESELLTQIIYPIK